MSCRVGRFLSVTGYQGNCRIFDVCMTENLKIDNDINKNSKFILKIIKIKLLTQNCRIFDV